MFYTNFFKIHKIYHLLSIYTLILLCQNILVHSIYAGEKRVALVIGNSNYMESPLINPVNDATDIGASLQALGFRVEVATNLSHTQIQEKIQAFGEQLNKADVGFFYYAGHGIQAEGTNYLIPISTDMSNQNAIINEAISISSILQKMEQSGNGINIIVLDACRNNPLTRRFSQSPSLEQGLAIVKAPSASFIAYATAPGNVAADGNEKNGLYTQYLLKNINIPGQTIEQLFKKVRGSVVQASNGAQVPWENSSLLGEFYFVELSESDIALANNQDYSIEQYELDFWQSIQKNPSRDLYESYLKKFPQGSFTLTVRQKLKELGNGQLTISSNVFGDSIKINGDFRGTSKSTFSLEPGKYSIEISKLGFNTIYKKINIQSKQHLSLQFAMQANKNHKKKSRSTSETLNSNTHTIKNQVQNVILPEPEVIQKIIDNKPHLLDAIGKNFSSTMLNSEIPNNKKATNEKLEPIITMPFVHVKSACFTMGSKPLEEGRLNDEKEHEVCLTKDFWIGKFEVTQEQWQKVMGYNPSFFKGCGGNCPVERVSWDEVQGFIFKLNLQTGQQYRLPTEAEWEYAARADTKLSTYAGDSMLLGQNNASNLNKIAWYSGNSSVKYKGGRYCEDWDEKEFTAIRCGVHSVGMKQPNPWMMYDMIGNIWEWTADIYGSLSTKKITDPQGALKGNKRVVKGGSWADSLSQNRSAARYGFSQNKKMNHVGFRLVRTID